ncbi:MAG TPA: lysophospholipid acyltransferase family protein [Smithellaceae bacterium]|nr:lysophospholipid acyltransferase family protein [Smithellaceae bacterium]
MFKKLRKIATVKLVGSLVYYLALIYSMTFRVKVINDHEWIDYVEKGGRVLLCCWHQQFFIAVRLISRYRKYNVSVMISKSTDGDIASRVAESAGVFPVRGSSSRNGGPALKEMISRFKDGRMALHLLDGPRGPAGIVKPGAIAIASGADAAIAPVYVQADRAWHARSWDQYMVPRPFSRVTVTFCPLLKIPSLLKNEEFERYRENLENILGPYLVR